MAFMLIALQLCVVTEHASQKSVSNSAVQMQTEEDATGNDS